MIETSAMAPQMRLTDDLDNEIITYLSNNGEASMREIANAIDRSRSTLMLRCLKLEAYGLIHSARYGNKCLFFVAPSVPNARHGIDG